MNVFYKLDHLITMVWNIYIGTAHIRHQCKKTTIFICHGCLIFNRVRGMKKFKNRLDFCLKDVSKWKVILVSQHLITFFHSKMV